MELKCSPRTYRRALTDREFCKELVAKAMLEDHGDVVIPLDDDTIVPNEVVEEREELNVEPDIQGFLDTGNTKKSYWLEAPTKLMLALMKEFLPQVGKNFSFKTKKKVWQAASEKLYEAGYMISSQQVEAKFYTLERRYKQCKLHNASTGRDRQACPYEAELDDLLGEKRSIYPEFTLEANTPVLPPSAEPEKQKTPKRKRQHDEFAEFCKSSTRELKAKFMEHLEKREERAKTREERAKTREERAERSEARQQRRMEILEKLSERINNSQPNL